MKDNFAPSLAKVLQHEGGLVDDSQDPGGVTNKGITQQTYDDWRVGEGLPKRSVQFVNGYEVACIYRDNYWDKIEGDNLPSGLDYCLFDFAVNSGPNRAIRFLQRSLNVADDGEIGPMTLAAVAKADVPTLIDQISSNRQAYLQSLSTFDHFGAGWTRRVSEVEADAKAMA